MPCKTVTVTIGRDGAMGHIPVPFDPKAVFGKVRAPVKVTLNGYTYRSTICVMGGEVFIPLRASNREAAGLAGGETLEVRIESDTEARVVELPDDLREAIEAVPQAWERWQKLSYTHRREHVEAVESARKPETRARRIASAVRLLEEGTKQA